MIKVFIPGKQYIPIWRQFKSKSNWVWGNCEFYFDECNDYDFLVIIDSINQPIKTTCPKEKRILFIGEPQTIKQYNKEFRNQFGHIYSCQTQLIYNNESKRLMPILPWMIGCSLQENTHICNSNKYLDFDDLLNLKNSHTINKACLITSNKKFTKGHRNRVNFANYILDNNIDFIDIYGNGFNSISDKIEVLSKYKYSIVIENCAHKDYWTEKLADCILSGSYPIYYGAPNIYEYFDQNSLTTINVENKQQSINIIKQVIESNLYDKKIDYMKKAKFCIMNNYNMFALISNVVETIQDTYTEYKKEDIILPMKFNISDKIKNYISWKFDIQI